MKVKTLIDRLQKLPDEIKNRDVKVLVFTSGKYVNAQLDKVSYYSDLIQVVLEVVEEDSER